MRQQQKRGGRVVELPQAKTKYGKLLFSSSDASGG